MPGVAARRHLPEANQPWSDSWWPRGKPVVLCRGSALGVSARLANPDRPKSAATNPGRSRSANPSDWASKHTLHAEARTHPDVARRRARLWRPSDEGRA